MLLLEPQTIPTEQLHVSYVPTNAIHVTQRNESQERVAEAGSPLNPAESVVFPQADNDEPPAGRGLESR